MKTQIEVVLENLEPRERRIIRLYYFDGLSMRAIGNF